MQAVASQPRVRARKGGFLRDMMTVSQRALRATVRDTEVIIPALVIPVFMYLMTVGALEDFAERIPGLDYRAFQIPVAVLFAVTGVSRAMTVVTDIQTGYFDRLVISPVNRLAPAVGAVGRRLRLGGGADRACHHHGSYRWSPLRHGDPGHSGVHGIGWCVGLGVCRIPLRHSLQDGEPGSSEHKLPALLPLPLHDHAVRPARSHDRVVGDSGRLQPGYLPPRCAPITGVRGVGAYGVGQGDCGCCSGGRGQLGSSSGRTEREGHSKIVVEIE